MTEIKKFGFTIHILEFNDIAKKYPKIQRAIEKYERDFPNLTKGAKKTIKAFLKRKKPFIITELSGIKSITGQIAQGWFAVVPMLPEQILEDDKYAVKKIIKACYELVDKKDVEVIGLGAHTAIAGQNGKLIIEALKDIVLVTTGNTYTVATAIEATEMAADLMEINLEDSTLAVVGATGSIGKVCAEILASKMRNTILVGRDNKKLIQVAKTINGNWKISTDIKAIKEAKVIITVTSAITPIINPEYVRPGTVICDVARPRDTSQFVRRRSDVLVIDGGVVKIPGNMKSYYYEDGNRTSKEFDFGHAPGNADACIAETIIIALEGNANLCTVGKNITIANVLEMQQLAQKHGFQVLGLRIGERELNPEAIKQIKNNVVKGVV